MQRNNSNQQAALSQSSLGKRPSSLQGMQTIRPAKETRLTEPNLFSQIKMKFHYIPKYGNAYAIFYCEAKSLPNLRNSILKKLPVHLIHQPSKEPATKIIWSNMLLAVNQHSYSYLANIYSWPAVTIENLPLFTSEILDQLCKERGLSLDIFYEIKTILEFTYSEPSSFRGINNKFKYTCKDGIFALLECDINSLNAIMTYINNLKYSSIDEANSRKIGDNFLLVHCYTELAKKYNWEFKTVEALPEFPNKDSIEDCMERYLSNRSSKASHSGFLMQASSSSLYAPSSSSALIHSTFSQALPPNDDVAAKTSSYELNWCSNVGAKFYYAPKHGNAYAIFYCKATKMRNIRKNILNKVVLSEAERKQLDNTQIIWPNMFLAVKESIYNRLAKKLHWPENIRNLPYLSDYILKGLSGERGALEKFEEIKIALEYSIYSEPQCFIGLKQKHKYSCDKGIFAIFDCGETDIMNIRSYMNTHAGSNSGTLLEDLKVQKINHNLLLVPAFHYNKFSEKFNWESKTVDGLPIFPNIESIKKTIDKILQQYKVSSTLQLPALASSSNDDDLLLFDSPEHPLTEVRWEEILAAENIEASQVTPQLDDDNINSISKNDASNIFNDRFSPK